MSRIMRAPAASLPTPPRQDQGIKRARGKKVALRETTAGRVRSHIGKVFVLIRSHRLHQLLAKRLGVVERGLVEPQGQLARADEVVGRDGRRQGQPLGLGRIDHAHDVGVELGVEHDAIRDGVRVAWAEDRANDRRQRDIPPFALGGGGRTRRLQLAHTACRQERLGAADQG
jgi:hypothetical protein